METEISYETGMSITRTSTHITVHAVTRVNIFSPYIERHLAIGVIPCQNILLPLPIRVTVSSTLCSFVPKLLTT